MKKLIDNDTLTIFIDGRLTADNAEKILDDINGLCCSYPDYTNLVINAAELEYISSAGLRILLKLSKLNKRSGKNFSVQNVSPEIYDIFRITGFDTFITVSKKLREISVEGCPLIGAGRSSNVYRIDPETIVKCYAPNVPLDNILH